MIVIAIASALAGPCSLAAASAKGHTHPRLVVKKVSGTPSSLPAGGSLTIRDRTENVGRAFAKPSRTVYLLSPSGATTAGTDITMLGQRHIPRLRPRRASTGSVVVPLSPSIEAGEYHLIACARFPPAAKMRMAEARLRARMARSRCRTSSITVSVSSAPTQREALRWPPPPLVDPTTISLGTGFTETYLDPGKDYIVDLPPTKKVGATVIVGGHNVLIVGGSITIPTGTKGDNEKRAIYVKDATGTVHIEGILIDGSGGAYFDGVDIAAPEATVQLENDRIVGVHGGFDTFHGDIVQPWGGVKDLRIDHLTGSSDYQGLNLEEGAEPIGSAELSNVDLTTLETSEPPALGGGYMLWLTSGSTTCVGFPVSLSQVYIQPRRDRTLGTSVWPPNTSALPCRAKVKTGALWPTLPVTGEVRAGAPGASFVPAGAAGLGYQPLP